MTTRVALADGAVTAALMLCGAGLWVLSPLAGAITTGAVAVHTAWYFYAAAHSKAALNDERRAQQ